MVRGRKHHPRGFTIIEILIALGLTSGLALILASLTNVSLKTTKNAQTSTDYQVVSALIRTALQDPTRCKQALLPMNYVKEGTMIPPESFGELVVVPEIKDPNLGPPLLTVGKRFGNLKVISIKLQHSVGQVMQSNQWTDHIRYDFPADPYEGARAKLLVEFQKEDAASTAPPTVYSLDIHVTVNKLRPEAPLTGCSANLSEGAGWNCPSCTPFSIPMTNEHGDSFIASGLNQGTNSRGDPINRVYIQDANHTGSIQFDFE